MTDREKVIKGLEHCGQPTECDGCPYDSEVGGCFTKLKEDALELLKEQEAIEPKEIVNEHFPIGDYRRTIAWLCGKCGKAHGQSKCCRSCAEGGLCDLIDVPFHSFHSPYLQCNDSFVCQAFFAFTHIYGPAFAKRGGREKNFF